MKYWKVEKKKFKDYYVKIVPSSPNDFRLVTVDIRYENGTVFFWGMIQL